MNKWAIIVIIIKYSSIKLYYFNIQNFSQVLFTYLKTSYSYEALFTHKYAIGIEEIIIELILLMVKLIYILF